MITATGYSKDPNIKPLGIALTLPVQFFTERGTTTEAFKKLFERYMAREDAIWNFRLTNLPTAQDLLWVYLIFDRHIQYRCNFVGYERNKEKTFVDAPDGRERRFAPANWVLFTGPAIKPAELWFQRGHQGFRYTTQIF
jgi:hypothetical protein